MKRDREAGGTSKGKRGQGRPTSGGDDVGAVKLIAAAEKLLRELPPARVTISRVAAEAGADPALIRYYFGGRTELLLAVANRVTENGPRSMQRTADPETALAEQIRGTIEFNRSAKFMHRLFIEELSDPGTESSRARLRDMNLDVIASYRELLEAEDNRTLAKVDPLFLHLLVLGTADFFAGAETLIQQLVPADADIDEVAARFQDFVVDLILNGLKRR